MAYFGFTNKLVKGETIKIFNYGNCKRDFTYVDDIVEGVVRVMKKAPDKKNGEDGLPIPPYAVYNIGNQNPENLLDFVQILSEELVRAKVLPEDYDFEAHKELVPMQPGDVPVTYADTSALERDFGYKPSTSLRTGLKVAAPFCDKIICISDAEKQSALDKKICKEDKLQVIFNGVDIEAYENGVHGAVKRRELNIPENAFVVGMVGRMSPQKAPDVFIKMAKRVKDKISNAHFIIVGNGNQEDEIRKYAEDNGFSDSLHITGWVDNPMSYVELFDVACLLSRWEGFGLALPEYMMAGKPIVASSVDAIPNIIRDGENGLLVEVDDAVGTSKAVLRIYQEDGLKDRLVAQGLEDVHEKFNARRVSEEHGKLFEKM